MTKARLMELDAIAREQSHGVEALLTELLAEVTRLSSILTVALPAWRQSIRADSPEFLTLAECSTALACHDAEKVAAWALAVRSRDPASIVAARKGMEE
jgi:hypothetical protein